MESYKKTRIFSGRQEDYLSWKMSFIASMTIKKLGLWVRDNPPIAPTTGDQKIEEWKEKNMELFSYILLSVDEETSQTIATLTKDGDGIMAWREIQKLFEKNDPLNISNLREEIQELRLEEGGDVGAYITKHTSLVARIQKAEDSETAVTEKAKIAYLLWGLPQSMRIWAFIKNVEVNLKIHTLKQDLRANAEFEAATFRSIRSEHQEESSFYSRDHGRSQSDRGHGRDPQVLEADILIVTPHHKSLKTVVLYHFNIM